MQKYKGVFFASLVWLIAIVAFLASFSSTEAAPKSGDEFGDWMYKCDTAPERKESICYLSQTLVTGKEKKGRILTTNIAYPKDSNEPIMIMLFPLGIAVQEKILIQVDEKKPVYEVPIETCLSSGCRTKVKLSSEILKSIRAGNNLKVSFKPLAAKRFVLAVSLKGISKGLKKLK